MFVLATSNDPNASGNITQSISHELKSRMSLNEARTMQNYKMSSVFYQRLKTHCKIYKGFVFLKTNIFVAHGHILSLYDMVSEKFTKHIEFDGDILEVFRS